MVENIVRKIDDNKSNRQRTLVIKGVICEYTVVMKIDSKEILRALEGYGLSRNEAAVYMLLLKRLEASAFEIAKATGIPRTTVYTTLESLKNQGIVSPFRKNNVAYFTPESPNQLIRLLKEREEIMNDIMPQIRALSPGRMDAPVAKLYVGIEGIKTGFADILDTLRDQKIKLLYATSQPALLTFLPKYFPNWLKQREELGVFTKLILPHNAHGYLSSNALRDVRYLPEKFPFDCSMNIYGTKMVFFSFRGDEPYCVTIESASMTEMFQQFFLFTWEMLK